jgi:DNA-binding LytR/AlgR family response regulator
MESIKVLLVEDLSYVEIALKERLIDLGFDVVGILPKPNLVKSFIEGNNVDIVISDLFLSEEYSILKLSKDLSEKLPLIILNGEDKVSSSTIEEINAFSLMEKPLKDLELLFNIKSACALFDNSNKHVFNEKSVEKSKSYIFVRADYRLNKIRVSDIYYLEAKKDYVTIHTSDNVYTVHATMKEMERILPTALFIRTHRSYIVNIDKIFSIKYPDILIEHKMKTIQIGGLYRKELFNKINVV